MYFKQIRNTGMYDAVTDKGFVFGICGSVRELLAVEYFTMEELDEYGLDIDGYAAADMADVYAAATLEEAMDILRSGDADEDEDGVIIDPARR